MLTMEQTESPRPSWQDRLHLVGHKMEGETRFVVRAGGEGALVLSTRVNYESNSNLLQKLTAMREFPLTVDHHCRYLQRIRSPLRRRRTTSGSAGGRRAGENGRTVRWRLRDSSWKTCASVTFPAIFVVKWILDTWGHPCVTYRRWTWSRSATLWPETPPAGHLQWLREQWAIQGHGQSLGRWLHPVTQEEMPEEDADSNMGRVISEYQHYEYNNATSQ